MAENFNVLVDGIDLSSNMVDIAVDYLATMSEKVKKNVTFKVEDATAMDYPENYYDMVTFFQKEILYHSLKSD